MSSFYEQTQSNSSLKHHSVLVFIFIYTYKCTYKSNPEKCGKSNPEKCTKEERVGMSRAGPDGVWGEEERSCSGSMTTQGKGAISIQYTNEGNVNNEVDLIPPSEAFHLK